MVGQLASYLKEKETQLLTDVTQAGPDEVNRALWSHIEILEGGVFDLFQQLSQTNLDKWDDALAITVQEIVNILRARLNFVKSTIVRLDAALSQNKERTWLEKILG